MVNKGIQIKNVYYMLSYAFRVLRESDYENIDSEEFENVYDLLAELLYRGISSQLKHGLKKDYISQSEDIYSIKGHINFSNTIKNAIKKNKQINCEFDQFTEDVLINQIIKSTVVKLLNVDSLNKETRKKLIKLKPLLDGIKTIQPNKINWSLLNLEKYSQNYKMMINMCYFIEKNTLLTENEGKYKSATFSDEQLNLVFQNFVMNYYKELFHKKNIKGIIKAGKVNYGIDMTKEFYGIEFLPEMQTDIMITVSATTLIIDTKFYSKIFATNREKKEYHANNIYQINSYVSHYSYNFPGQKTSGMLLYAKTNEETAADTKYNDIGHWFYVNTIDLNKDFNVIKEQLNQILENAIRF